MRAGFSRPAGFRCRARLGGGLDSAEPSGAGGRVADRGAEFVARTWDRGRESALAGTEPLTDWCDETDSPRGPPRAAPAGRRRHPGPGQRPLLLRVRVRRVLPEP